MGGWEVLAAAFLLAWAAGADFCPDHDAAATAAAPLRVFFVTDVHSSHDALERLIRDARRARPALILDGGDVVHDGTSSEFRRAMADRDRLDRPWRIAPGNHDVYRAGPFPSPPPRWPAFDAFTCGGVGFVLLDNHEERLTEAQFDRLEAELEARAGQPVVVVLHVPPRVSRLPFMIRLRHLVPFILASPTMTDDAQVDRFTRLMARHRVVAVLAGHAHFHDDQTIDGVRYLVGGTAGGLIPGLAIPHEYLDLTLHGRDLHVRRVRIRDPAGDPVTFVARAYRFFSTLNRFNHDAQGWNYVPSVGVQARVGARSTRPRGNDHVADAAAVAAVSFERVFGPTGNRGAFTDLGLSAAPRELTAEVATGYKLRPAGDFNRNAFVAAGATANGGMLGGRGSAGLGARLELGVEWRALTVAVRRDWATNHRSTALLLGRRH